MGEKKKSTYLFENLQSFIHSVGGVLLKIAEKMKHYGTIDNEKESYIFEADLIVLAESGDEDDRGHLREAVDPLLALVSLASHLLIKKDRIVMDWIVLYCIGGETRHKQSKKEI